MNGYFKTEIVNGVLTITVCPPICGNPVTTDEVMEFLRVRGVDEVSESLIDSIVEEAAGEPVELVTDVQHLVRNAEIRLYVAPNRMRAEIEVVPARWGERLTASELQLLAINAGINYGVVSDVFEEIVAHQDEGGSWVLAEGLPPKEGEDGRVEFYFDLSACDKRPRFLNDGSVNLRSIKNMQLVRKGEPLARLISASNGVPGKDVFGDFVFPRTVSEATIPRGINTAVSPGGEILVAEVDGQVHLDKKGLLCINPVCQVEGNVDYSVGNIEFLGDVIVQGNVLNGFEIVTDGNVIVSGYVEAAVIKAGGDIIVSGGIQGRDKGYISAGKSIYTKFIENADAGALENIVVSEDIMNSTVRAGKSIQVQSIRGKIVGGELCAGANISSAYIGSPVGTKTLLEVGSNPFSTNQYQKISEKYQDMLKQYKQIKEIERTLTTIMEANGGKLPDNKQSMYIRVRSTIGHLEKERMEYEQQLGKLEQTVIDIFDVRVMVSKKIFSGTEIIIGKSTKRIKNTYYNVAIRLSDSRDVVVSSA